MKFMSLMNLDNYFCIFQLHMSKTMNSIGDRKRSGMTSSDSDSITIENYSSSSSGRGDSDDDYENAQGSSPLAFQFGGRKRCIPRGTPHPPRTELRLELDKRFDDHKEALQHALILIECGFPVVENCGTNQEAAIDALYSVAKYLRQILKQVTIEEIVSRNDYVKKLLVVLSRAYTEIASHEARKGNRGKAVLYGDQAKLLATPQNVSIKLLLDLFA